MEVQSIHDIGVLVKNGYTQWGDLGSVKVRPMLNGALLNFCYTPLAQYQNRWNAFERLSRGLILANVTGYGFSAGDVVALAYPKFFNWTPQLGEDYKNEIPVIEEKVDGSLILVFVYGDDIYCATKAGIDTDIAALAKETLLKNIQDLSEFIADVKGYTFVFEYTSSQNRVVINYGEEPLLTLLTIFNVKTTIEERHKRDFFASKWGFNIPQPLELLSFKELLASINTFSGIEGFIIRYTDGTRFKIKTDEYILLHRNFTANINIKVVARYMATNSIDELIAIVIDELYNEINSYVAIINQRVSQVVDEIKAQYDMLGEYTTVGDNDIRTHRKLFAQQVAQLNLSPFCKSALYQLYSHKVEKKVFPPNLTSPKVISYLIDNGEFDVRQ